MSGADNAGPGHEAPLVSVFIGTYDRKDVLPRALESVLDQTYPNLEIIVVDDHSPEDPWEVVESFDGPITYVRHEENRGWGAAMNTAHEHASGSFFAMIGDDDAWNDPDKLRKQLEAYRSTGRSDVGIVCTGWREVSESTGKVKAVRRPERPDDLVEHILGENRVIQSISAVVTREAWVAVGGCDEELPRGIDSDLFRRIILAGFDVLFVREPMIDIYVDRSDRMTGKRSIDGIEAHIEGELRKFEKFPEAFERYPRARSRVLEKVGVHHLRLYRLTGKVEHLRRGRDYLRRSLRSNLLHWKAWVRYGWSYYLSGSTILGRLRAV